MNGYTLRQLIEQREALDKQIAQMRAEMREGKLAEARALIEEFDFNAYELGLIKTQHVVKRGRKEARTFQAKASPQPRQPLYRDPATGVTWSGRGRPPHWVEGHTDEYVIKEH
jgi:DNA-binding protein H-NS